MEEIARTYRKDVEEERRRHQIDTRYYGHVRDDELGFEARRNKANMAVSHNYAAMAVQNHSVAPGWGHVMHTQRTPPTLDEFFERSDKLFVTYPKHSPLNPEAKKDEDLYRGLTDWEAAADLDAAPEAVADDDNEVVTDDVVDVPTEHPLDGPPTPLAHEATPCSPTSEVTSPRPLTSPASARGRNSQTSPGCSVDFGEAAEPAVWRPPPFVPVHEYHRRNLVPYHPSEHAPLRNKGTDPRCANLATDLWGVKTHRGSHTVHEIATLIQAWFADPEGCVFDFRISPQTVEDEARMHRNRLSWQQQHFHGPRHGHVNWSVDISSG